MSGPTNTVGRRWLASFQHSAPSRAEHADDQHQRDKHLRARAERQGERRFAQRHWPQTAR